MRGSTQSSSRVATCVTLSITDDCEGLRPRSPQAAARMTVASICWQRRRESSSDHRRPQTLPSPFHPPATAAIEMPFGTRCGCLRQVLMVDVHQQAAARSFARGDSSRRVSRGGVSTSVVRWCCSRIAGLAATSRVFQPLRSLATSARCTGATLYDKDNHAAFTIFQERRVGTSLSDLTAPRARDRRHRRPAVLRPRRRRSRAHCRRGGEQSRASRGAGGSTLTTARARVSSPPTRHSSGS